MPADLTVQPTGQVNSNARQTARRDARSAPPAPGQQPSADHETQATDAGKAVAAANEQLKQIDSELSFQLDNETGIVVVKLIDRNTREVLRQVPSKEALAIAQAITQGGGPGKIVKVQA
ncbi:MAG TPA: flagellar protein FlaG [Burkholderiaceae bacterium]|nr:flagellar protein FlaG [Burkholderiaceae bacterium]